MFSSVELGRSSCKKSRLWSSCSGAKLSTRRIVGQLALSRRLTLVVVWALVVIYFLYRSLSSSLDLDLYQSSSHLQDAEQSEARHLKNDPTETIPPDQLISTIDFQPSHKFNDLNPITGFAQPRNLFSTSTKRPSRDYTRRGKVFILIVRSNESDYVYPRRTSQTDHIDATKYKSSKYIQPHIRILIDVLTAHRIEYVIGHLITGLPESLLSDQGLTSDKRQFSVIVIDDFIKYMRLDRWARDQLDRHCSSNQIGVISYLSNSSGKINSLPRNKLASLDEQFPLTFSSLSRDHTKKCTKNPSAEATPCLVDYQLNDKSPILRVVKRQKSVQPDHGLGVGIDNEPWVYMTSNHVTYDPITWVRLRAPASPSPLESGPDPELTTTDRFSGAADSKLESTVTRNRNQRSPISGSLDAQVSDDGDYVDPGRVSEYDDQLTYEAIDKHKSSYDNSSDSEHDTNSFSVEPMVDFGGVELHPLSVYDRGLYDGIKRVIFGGSNRHWLNRLLLLDAIEYLSSGQILSPLDRYIQIDVDDIFVGERGIRLRPADVDAMLETQSSFSKRIQGGFKFNLGFSGKFFKHGTDEENLADDKLIRQASEFTWFCHFWSHAKAHLLNTSEDISNELRQNLNFARQYDLPIVGQPGSIKSNQQLYPTYAVAPHHSGVYPIHSQLFEAWRAVLNVSVTSTEEYPHLRPPFARRAFVHKAIKVLPRQTCGLYTHTIYRKKYPGGIKRLQTSIMGGELFNTVLHNPINIYMTHMSNYANDRLALYTFEALFNFVQNNTNLRLRYAPSWNSSGDNFDNPLGEATMNNGQLGPSSLADYYFDLYPTERTPVWTNPCSDRRHMAIWAPDKHKLCSFVPKLLIVGPQKTGTTALYTFLKMNPQLRSSKASTEDFEEIQFFDDKHYSKGVDWYFERFLPDGATKLADGQEEEEEEGAKSVIHFDKSATYFDDPKAAWRASQLLPTARIVIMLIDPADRAYSWYQHMRAHGDRIANLLSFEQLLASSDLDIHSKIEGPATRLSSQTIALRNRCLHPGYYAKHLNRWLEFYPSHQVIVIDGQWFRMQPAPVMNKLQLLLRVDRPLDYRKLLAFDKHKGFFCQLKETHNGNSTSCLGKSKGRHYKPMSRAARAYLNKLYWPHNKQLARILTDIGQPLPTWLDESMSLRRVL